MATVTSKIADRQSGAVFLEVADKNGIASKHTIYVVGLNGRTIDQTIADILANADAAADAINAAFAQAGV